MPLSEHEQRILAEIERRLLEEDPKFAHQVGSSFRAHLGRRLKLSVAGFVLGLIIVISSTFLESVAVGVAGFVLMLACVFLFVRTMRRRATVEGPVSGPAPRPGQPRRPPAPPGRRLQGRRRRLVGQDDRTLALPLGGARRPGPSLKGRTTASRAGQGSGVGGQAAQAHVEAQLEPLVGPAAEQLVQGGHTLGNWSAGREAK